MNLVDWSPFRGIDEFFNRPFSGFLAGSDSGDNPRLLSADVAWRPAADISETDKEYLIKAQLPGVAKEAVNISFDRGVLTIEGERKVNKSSEDEKLRRTESFYGKYSRSFSLPDDVDEEKVKAHSKDGVLTVHLPKLKRAEHQPKKIAIE